MNQNWLSLTWWIPLPDPIDLPDGHTRRITSLVPPSVAVPDGNPLSESGSLFEQLDHEVELTVHQRELKVPTTSPLQEEIFRASTQTESLSSVELSYGTSTRSKFLSVVEAQVRVYDVDAVDEDIQSTLFDLALDRVRQLQEAMALLTENLNKELVARERLPVMLPLRILSSDAGASEADGHSAFLVNEFDLADAIPPEPIAQSRFDDLTTYLQQDEQDEGFTAYHRLRYATWVACYRRGDYRMTILSAAIAAESLLDEMLKALLWEEGNYPEAVAPKFLPDRSSLLKRVKSEYARHLGGEWSPKKKGTIRDWRENIAEPRNAIAHAGAMVTSEQARSAVRTLGELEKFLSQRLRAKVGDRPRAATLFIGARVLASEGLVSKRLNKLFDDPTEPHWVSTFKRWCEVLELELASSRGTRIKPDRDRSVVVVVVGTTGPDFVLLDEAISMATRISPVPDVLRKQYERWVANMKKDGFNSGRDEVCRLVLDTPETKHQLQLEDWKYAYKLVPTFNVMANRRDRN